MRLTAIGMGTAFALLLLLTLVIMLVGKLFGPTSRFAIGGDVSTSAESGAEAHDKALAAVVAVGAMLGKSEDVEVAGDAGT